MHTSQMTQQFTCSFNNKFNSWKASLSAFLIMYATSPTASDTVKCLKHSLGIQKAHKPGVLHVSICFVRWVNEFIISFKSLSDL